MKIHEVIRMYRKKRNMTQEQLANYLGVTAPAVNKWESGASYPDITLLAPLARVLEINMDTLMSFREDLTDDEINRYTQEVHMQMQQEGFQAAYEKAVALVREYPGSEKLILYMAQMLWTYSRMLSEEEQAQYEPRLLAWFWQVAKGNDTELVTLASSSLCAAYVVKEDYEKAQELLDQIPPLGYDKRPMQGTLYLRQGEKDRALEIFEQILYQSANEVICVLQQMLEITCQEKEYDKAQKYADLAEQIAGSLELGSYIASAPGMLIAVEKQDTEKALHYLKQMIDGMNRFTEDAKGELYSHMKFQEIKNKDMIVAMLKKGLTEDVDLSFLNGDPRFEELMRKLEE